MASGEAVDLDVRELDGEKVSTEDATAEREAAEEALAAFVVGAETVAPAVGDSLGEDEGGSVASDDAEAHREGREDALETPDATGDELRGALGEASTDSVFIPVAAGETVDDKVVLVETEEDGESLESVLPVASALDAADLEVVAVMDESADVVGVAQEVAERRVELEEETVEVPSLDRVAEPDDSALVAGVRDELVDTARLGDCCGDFEEVVDSDDESVARAETVSDNEPRLVAVAKEAVAEAETESIAEGSAVAEAERVSAEDSEASELSLEDTVAAPVRDWLIEAADETD